MISKYENTYPDAAFVVFGDFNHCNLKSVLPKYVQSITFPTRGKNMFDKCYSNLTKAFTAVPEPNFGKSDHIAILLQPTYSKKLKAEPVTVMTLQK